MRVLIVGASGQIGHALYRRMARHHDVSGTYNGLVVDPRFTDLDVCDAALTAAVVRAARPEVVVLTAALTHVDRCETEPDLAERVNVGGTRHVLGAARACGARVVYFSTDYVFDGRGGPYREDDPPRPINAYGLTKLAAEELVRAAGPEHLVVRVTNVYGWEPQGKNFVMRLIGRLGRGEAMRLPTDQVASPTYVENLAEAVQELIEAGRGGVYNVVGPDLLDRYRFGLLAAEVFGLDHSLLVPVTTPELGQAAPRPLLGGLVIDKARQALRTRLLGAREGLEEMKREAPRGVEVLP